MIGAGAFVRFGGELADVYEGLLPVRLLRGERFDLNQTETALVGRRSGRALRLGDPITVQGGLRRPAARARGPPAGGGLRWLSQAALSKRKPASGDVATNRRAGHKFELLDRFECGIELLGTEVKSLREGKAQLGDAYAVIERGEVWLRNAHIPPYAPASRENHDPERPRKLLLHRYEIERLVGRSQRRGLTLIPTRIYFKGPRAKVELALARGKEQRDRRREIRDRDQQREMEREHRRRFR